MKDYSQFLARPLGLLLCMFIGIAANTQKVKKDDIGVFNYNQPRMSKALDWAETYQVIAEVADDGAYRRRLYEDGIAPEPFIRADANSDPDFTIEVKESPVFFSEPERKVKRRTVNGESVNFYYYKGNYRGSVSMRIVDKDGNTVISELIKVSEFVEGSAMRSASEARDDFFERKVKWRERCAEFSARDINSFIQDRYTDVPKSITFYLARVSGKHDYDDYTAALEAQKQLFMDYQTNSGVTDEMAARLEANRAAWLKILEESDTETKKARINAKVTAAVKYHLGFTHFLLGEYTDANTMFRQAGQLEKFIVHNAPSWIDVADTVQGRYDNWEDEK